jgi:hypothetical protein
MERGDASSAVDIIDEISSIPTTGVAVIGHRDLIVMLAAYMGGVGGEQPCDRCRASTRAVSCRTQ